MAEAVRRSGAWVVCRIGCTECCMGPFPIGEADAARLRRGMAEIDPARATAIRERAARPQGDDDPCPALHPETSACELYAWRPVTCRTFGPAVRGASGAIGACELCYQGATDEEIAACAVDLDLGEEEGDLTVATALR